MNSELHEMNGTSVLLVLQIFLTRLWERHVEVVYFVFTYSFFFFLVFVFNFVGFQGLFPGHTPCMKSLDDRATSS